MGRQVSSKMYACFLCIMRRQLEDLFTCEKRHPKSAKRGSAYVQKTTRKNWHLKCAKKTHAKIGTLNLQNEAVSICKKSTCKNWHVKSAKRGSVYLQKKYAQNEAVSICKKSTRKNWHVKSAKRGSAYVQNKYAQKLAC